MDRDLLPVANANVRIGAQTVATAADGGFSVDGVPAAYDALVTNDAFAISVFSRYEALTSRSPTLMVDAQSGWSTAITGTVNPMPAQPSYVALGFAGTNVGHVIRDGSSGLLYPGGKWSTDYILCAGDGPVPALVSAVTFIPRGDGFPTSYDAFAQKNVVIGFGGKTTLAPIDLGPAPPQGQITIDATAPANVVELRAGVRMNLGNHAFVSASGNGMPVSPVPTIALTGATVGVNVLGHAPFPDGGALLVDYVFAGIGGRQPTDTVSLTLPGPISTTSPIEGAAGVDPTTPLQWQPMANAAYVVDVICFVDSKGIYQGQLVTAANQASLVLEPTLGLNVPSGATCRWHVTAIGPAASADDLVDGTQTPESRVYASERPASTFGAMTGQHSFTVK